MHKTMKTELIYYSFLPNCWGKFSRGDFGDLLKWGGGVFLDHAPILIK